MNPTTTTHRPDRRRHYVDVQAGWRFFFFAVAITAMLGLSFRIYFSPQRIKSWIVSALEQRTDDFLFTFDTAELRLSEGALPQFAILLKKVEFAPAPDCVSAPSIQAAEVRLPFHLLSLFRGEIRAGTLAADDMVVDLDRLKKRCEASHSAQSPAPTRTESSEEAAPVRESASAEVDRLRWWRAEQLQAIQSLILGIRLSKVEIHFEDGKKHVFLESFHASSKPGDDFIHLESSLRIPPALTYGETLPLLALSAKVKADAADVHMKAAVSEGNLKVQANLKPAEDRGLHTAAHLAVVDLPLSTVAPLLKKTDLAGENFKPSFLWLDCEARIEGNFQGLLRKEPLQLSQCRIDGNSGEVYVESATRLPDGKWTPFQVQLKQVDLKKALDTFAIPGPDGVATDYGRLSGKLDVKSSDEFITEGVIEGAQVRFSNRNVRALQKVNSLKLQAKLDHGQLSGKLSDVVLDQGHFDGLFSFQLNRDSQIGRFSLEVQSLQLREAVQDLLFQARVQSMGGNLRAQYSDGVLSSLNGDMRLKGIKGSDYSIENIKFAVSMAKPGRVDLNVIAPQAFLSHQSKLFASSQPLFFGHAFADTDWIIIDDVLIRSEISSTGDVTWSEARGALENGRIQVLSSGQMTKGRALSGWVRVDYPRFKKLKWMLEGTTSAPKLTEDKLALAELRRRSVIDRAVLGLPQLVYDQKNQGINSSSAAGAATRKLQELGKQVIEKARKIVPKERGAPDLTSGSKTDDSADKTKSDQ